MPTDTSKIIRYLIELISSVMGDRWLVMDIRGIFAGSVGLGQIMIMLRDSQLNAVTAGWTIYIKIIGFDIEINLGKKHNIDIRDPLAFKKIESILYKERLNAERLQMNLAANLYDILNLR